jgi:hypothetical protein
MTAAEPFGREGVREIQEFNVSSDPIATDSEVVPALMSLKVRSKDMGRIGWGSDTNPEHRDLKQPASGGKVS